MEEPDMTKGAVVMAPEHDHDKAKPKAPARTSSQPISLLIIHNAPLDARPVYKGIRYAARAVVQVTPDQTLVVILLSFSSIGQGIPWKMPVTGQQIVTDTPLTHVEEAEDALWEWAVETILAHHG